VRRKYPCSIPADYYITTLLVLNCCSSFAKYHRYN